MQQRLLTNRPCRVCFIGDSLTEFWQHTGKLDWESSLLPLRSVNLGLAADRTEHIMERIRRLDFSRAKPELVVLMMGTNNLGMEPPDAPEDVLKAVQGAVAMLRQKLPQTKLLILTIPPSGEEPQSALRRRILRTNQLLVEGPWPAEITILSVYDLMIEPDGRWKAGYTLDGTHFSASGYARFAQALLPAIHKMLEPKVDSPEKSRKTK